jgi:hypothetical protein
VGTRSSSSVALTESPRTGAIECCHGSDLAHLRSIVRSIAGLSVVPKSLQTGSDFHHSPHIGENSPSNSTGLFHNPLDIQSTHSTRPFLKIKTRVTSQNKCDASHHRNTLMFVVKAPYTTWQYFNFVILF